AEHIAVRFAPAAEGPLHHLRQPARYRAEELVAGHDDLIGREGVAPLWRRRPARPNRWWSTPIAAWRCPASIRLPISPTASRNSAIPNSNCTPMARCGVSATTAIALPSPITRRSIRRYSAA